MTLHTRQNPHGEEKYLSIFERHQGSASTVNLYFCFSFFQTQFDANIIMFSLFTWSQVDSCYDQQHAVHPGIWAIQPHFPKPQVTWTTVLIRLCRSHCQQKGHSQFPSYGIIKGNSSWVFSASTELWGWESASSSVWPQLQLHKRGSFAAENHTQFSGSLFLDYNDLASRHGWHARSYLLIIVTSVTEKTVSKFTRFQCWIDKYSQQGKTCHVSSIKGTNQTIKLFVVGCLFRDSFVTQPPSSSPLHHGFFFPAELLWHIFHSIRHWRLLSWEQLW